MKKIIIYMMLIFSTSIFSKDIYVGDLIPLNIEGVKKEELIQAFNSPNVLIEKIENNGNSYQVFFRIFEVGEKEFNLGNKKIILEVKSTLSEEDKDIYLNLSDKSDTVLYSKNFPYELIVSGIIGFISLILLIKGLKFRRKDKEELPEEKFERVLNSLGENTWQFEISLALREYIDFKYNSHFTNGIYKKIGSLDSEDIKFIESLDRYKFSLEKNREKDKYIKKVRNIYEKVKGGETHV